MAEQEIYEAKLGHLGADLSTWEAPNAHLSNLGKASTSPSLPRGFSRAKQDTFAARFGIPSFNTPVDASFVGIFKSTLLPSLELHTGLSLIAYTASRSLDRIDAKDLLWPTAPLINAWYCALGTHSLSPRASWSTTPYPQKLILSGLTLWSLRLLSHLVSRSLIRGHDDPRYASLKPTKASQSYWNSTAIQTFALEGFVQFLLSLPFTLSLRNRENLIATSRLPANPGWQFAHVAGIFLFTSGLALEILADFQLARHQKEKKTDVLTEGAWSISRHPNYLASTLLHTSFPLILYASGTLNPLALLGPIANYIYLAHLASTSDAHLSQKLEKFDRNRGLAQLEDYQRKVPSFWPSVDAVQNQWQWAVWGAGAVGVLAEWALRR